MTKAMVFPGQGSQSVGMQADLAAEYPVVQQTYAEASDILEYDLWSLVQTGPAEKLAATEITQPAMLTAGTAAFRVWRAAGGAAPDQVAGHSLGEYSALVSAGAISFEDALQVVMVRGLEMARAGEIAPGAMAVIIGADEGQIERFLCTIQELSEVLGHIADMIGEPVPPVSERRGRKLEKNYQIQSDCQLMCQSK